MNIGIFTGRATGDAALGTTSTGKNVCRFSLAIDRGFGDSKQTDFVNCSVFGARAESAVKCVKKGAIVSVNGTVTASAYEKNGEVKASLSVLVNDFKIENYVSSKKRNDEEQISLEDYSGDVPF